MSKKEVAALDKTAQQSSANLPITVDARGKWCPIPLLYLQRAIEQAERSGISDWKFLLWSTDPGSSSELSAYTDAHRYKLTPLEPGQSPWEYDIYLIEIS